MATNATDGINIGETGIRLPRVGIETSVAVLILIAIKAPIAVRVGAIWIQTAMPLLDSIGDAVVIAIRLAPIQKGVRARVPPPRRDMTLGRGNRRDRDRHQSPQVASDTDRSRQ